MVCGKLKDSFLRCCPVNIYITDVIIFRYKLAVLCMLTVNCTYRCEH